MACGDAIRACPTKVWIYVVPPSLWGNASYNYVCTGVIGCFALVNFHWQSPPPCDTPGTPTTGGAADFIYAPIDGSAIATPIGFTSGNSCTPIQNPAAAPEAGAAVPAD